MVTIWSILSSVVLPAGLFLLVLVTIPLPAFVMPLTNQIVGALMDLELVQFKNSNRIRLTLFNLMFSIALLTFATQTKAMWNMYEKGEVNTGRASGLTIERKASIWRAERNFWITVCCVMTYWCLYRHTALRKRYSVLKEEKKETEERTKKD